MKRILLFARVFAFVCLLCATLPAAAAEVQYSSILSDLPLMPGLVEKPETLVMFDKPEGRIAEIAMTAPTGQIEVLAYYRETLPALGWRGENPQIWRRQGQQLTLRFAADRGVIFQLAPISVRGQ